MKYNILFIYITFIFLSSCKDSAYWREKNNKYKEWFEYYEIQSIRIDDDSEYHIVAVSKLGNVKTFHDLNEYDFFIRYGKYSNTLLKIKCTDLYSDSGNYSEIGYPNVYIPFGYKIETFND